MATQVQRRRGTTAQHATFTGAEGELTVDTTKDTVVVHDGSTAGGFAMAREDLSNVSTIAVAKGGTGATTLASGGYLKGNGTSAITSQTGIPGADITSGDIAAARITNALNASGSAPIYACRAWVNFNGTGTVAIRAAGNVSSITDNGPGSYTVNFTTAMPDSDYAVTGCGRYGSDTNAFTVGLVYEPRTSGNNRSTSQLQISTAYVDAATAGQHSTLADLVTVNVAIFR